MRSDLVHSANRRLSNRFLLCRMTSVSARRMQAHNGHFAQSINKALKHIAVLPADGATPDTSTLPDHGPLATVTS